jgi:GNAT superfamily N-acetyltransferase
MIILKRCNSNNQDFKILITKLDSDLNGRYGKLQSQYNEFNQIENIETVVIAYFNNFAVGCGCFKQYNDKCVEIKRMYVKPEYRGKGIAIKILSELENWAKEKGNKSSILETGLKQNEAINLYTKLGYYRIDNFGQYKGNENSICMEKTF